MPATSAINLFDDLVSSSSSMRNHQKLWIALASVLGLLATSCTCVRDDFEQRSVVAAKALEGSLEHMQKAGAGTFTQAELASFNLLAAANAVEDAANELDPPEGGDSHWVWFSSDSDREEGQTALRGIAGELRALQQMLEGVLRSTSVLLPSHIDAVEEALRGAEEARKAYGK